MTSLPLEILEMIICNNLLDIDPKHRIDVHNLRKASPKLNKSITCILSRSQYSFFGHERTRPCQQMISQQLATNILQMEIEALQDSGFANKKLTAILDEERAVIDECTSFCHRKYGMNEHVILLGKWLALRAM